MQPNRNVKNVTAVNEDLENEDEETGLIMLCAPAPSRVELKTANIGIMKDYDDAETQPMLLRAAVAPINIELKKANISEIMKEKLSMHIPREIPKKWATGVIPFPSNEYRKARTVFDVTVDEATLAARLFLLMRTRSICAVYKGSTATCKTSSYMKFTIRLLRNPAKDGSIFVDVRRRAGCAMAFRDEHQAIKRAVLHGECELSNDRRVMMESFADKPFMQGKYIPLGEDVIQQSLEESVRHLDSKYYDARQLTVQDLISTTDPASKDTSPKACKLILEKFPKILNYIVNDVKKRVEYGDVNDDDSDEQLRSLTLNLLYNVLSSDPKNETLILLVNNESIIDHLVWYVGEASTCPWNACLAAKCLGKLKSISSKDVEVYDALEKAEKVGENTHHLLQKEANFAISEISGCK